MKKVTFVINYLGMGGEQNVATMIANELQKKNDVDLVSFYGEKESFYTLKIKSTNFPQEKKINLIIRKTLTRLFGDILKRNVSPFFMNHKQKERLKHYLIKRKPDTVILVGELPYYTKFLKCNFPNMRIILWFHQSFSLYYERVFRYSRKLFIQSCKKADEIILLTSLDVMEAERFNIKAKCIYNPLSLNGTGKHDLDSKIVGFAGRFAIEQKGLDILSAVASELPEGWKLNIAGGGKKSEIRKTKRLFNKISTRKYDFIGQLDKSEVANFLSNLSMYLMTSRWEGMPLILLEAMSFGLPIIAFDQNGSREILGDSEFGILVPQGNVSLFNKFVKLIISDRELRDNYSRKSLKRVQDFNLDKIITEWEEVL